MKLVEMDKYQELLVMRAQSVTKAQIELAKELVMLKFAGLGSQDQARAAIEVSSILATNYLAEIQRTKE